MCPIMGVLLGLVYLPLCRQESRFTLLMVELLDVGCVVAEGVRFLIVLVEFWG